MTDTVKDNLAWAVHRPAREWNSAEYLILNDGHNFAGLKGHRPTRFEIYPHSQKVELSVDALREILRHAESFEARAKEREESWKEAMVFPCLSELKKNAENNK